MGYACGDGGATPTGTDNAVRIDSIEPSSGTIGTEIVIQGSGFDHDANDIGFTLPGSASRTFNIGYQDGVPSPDGKTLRFTLQDTLGACAFSQMGQDAVCPAVGIMVPIGDVSVAVFNRNGTSNSVVFHREASPIEVAEAVVDQSPAYRELTSLLDQKVRDSYQPASGQYSVSVGIGFRQSDNGDVYIEVSVHGVDMNELRDAIPSQIEGYEVRTNP
jgi:IPT/TIG domain.